jgi:hypothetical protein
VQSRIVRLEVEQGFKITRVGGAWRVLHRKATRALVFERCTLGKEKKTPDPFLNWCA